MPTVRDVLAALDELAPRRLAADWDNIGLLLGDTGTEVKRILTCLTVTPDTAAEAVQESCQLIVCHHPVLFRAVKRLTSADSEGRVLLGLLQAGVAVASPHTAWDNAPGGINDQLAAIMNLREVVPLRPAPGPESRKIVVFVPDTDLARVSDALFAAGAGRIGAYSECSFRVAGTGTFFGLQDAKPAVGVRGRREEVAEWRLEVVVRAEQVPAALAAIRRSHSYEEPAVDVYPLATSSAVAQGEGRVGALEPATTLVEFARSIKSKLGGGLIQVVGENEAPLRRAAVVCGAGGSLLGDAAAAGADVLVTGELRFHECLAAQARGLGVVLLGHYASERLGVENLARSLQSRFPELQIWASRCEADPLRPI